MQQNHNRDEVDKTFTNGAAGMYLYAEILDA